eukprot:Gb_28346 [translate_table: standard]
MVVTSLKSGVDPWKEGNWVAWGYRKLFSYIVAEYKFPNITTLPNYWGIDELPCFKVSPMDCFKEGGDFDYPKPLQQIDQPTGCMEGLVNPSHQVDLLKVVTFGE